MSTLTEEIYNLATNIDYTYQYHSEIIPFLIKSKIKETYITWSDVGGLEKIKKLLEESLHRSSMSKPWEGILLYGPPGSGKSMLATSLPRNSGESIYNIPLPNVLSNCPKHPSEFISYLYFTARNHPPSVIFIDDIDIFNPSDEEVNNAVPRKIISTLLGEMDKISEMKDSTSPITLAATNRPWNIDSAVLSRFPRKIYIPPPDVDSCEAIIKINMKGIDVSGVNLKSVAQKCVDMLYTGRDLGAFCNKAWRNMIIDANPVLSKPTHITDADFCSMSWKIRPLTMSDFECAWKNIRSNLTKQTIERYETWGE